MVGGKLIDIPFREGNIELEGYSTRYREGLDLVLRQVSATIQVHCSKTHILYKLQMYLVGRASTPRLRLGVLASQLVNIALKLHSEEHKYIEAKSISAKLKFNSASPR